MNSNRSTAASALYKIPGAACDDWRLIRLCGPFSRSISLLRGWGLLGCRHLNKILLIQQCRENVAEVSPGQKQGLAFALYWASYIGASSWDKYDRQAYKT